MNTNPFFSSINDLTTIEVFHYFDQPLLYSAKDVLGNAYLVYFYDKKNDDYIWLIIPMSTRRLNQLCSSEIDLLSAIKNSELRNIIYYCDTRSNQDNYKLIDVNDLDIATLPDPGIFLHSSQANDNKLEPAQLVANQLNRTLLRMHLSFKSTNATMEAPAKELGSLLVSLQDLLNSIGQAILHEPAEFGRIQNDVISESKLNFIGAGMGSIVIDLASTSLNNLFGDSEVDPAIEKFIDLVNIGNNEDLLNGLLKILQPRVAQDYYDFLNIFLKPVKEATFEWASPKLKQSRISVLSSSTAEEIMMLIQKGEVIDNEIIEVFGELVGANIRTKKIELMTSDNQKYECKIPDENVSQVSGSVIGGTYRIILKRTNTKKTTTGKIDANDVLISISPI